VLQSGFAQQKIAFHHHPAQLLVKFGQLALAQLLAWSQMIGEHPRRRLYQRLLPSVDLVRMDPEASREFGHRGLPTQCGECNLGLESWIMFASAC
jgi:hypothetical protein